MKPLDNIRIVSLAVNLPGPVAAAGLLRQGAAVVKVEPPDGDPLAAAHPEWYRALHQGQEVLRLNLKDDADCARLHDRLARADLFLTAVRPAALQRLGLSWPELHPRYPRLLHVGIVGHPAPDEDLPGHDLTYQARLGLLTPPHLPRVLVADWAGAHAVVSATLGLVLARERGQGCHSVQVSLAEAAADFAEPLRHGLTAPGGLLGGGLPNYNLYRARDGWIAIAALEGHFWERLLAELGLSAQDREAVQNVFATRSAAEWEAWAAERDLPLAAVAAEAGGENP
jgi:crotonobetainyl-CoA:carnitine CoA-transferase CaiB-like acyl-CoA transferase